MQTRISHLIMVLIIMFMLITGCDKPKEQTSDPQDTEAPAEVELIPTVQGPQGQETPDPIEQPDAPLNAIALPALSTFRNIFGSPHILEDGVCYYMGSWNPGATLMMLLFIEDTIIACETLTYNEDVLYSYIPQLIESIQHSDRDVANKALDFLTTVMRLKYPNGYFEQYTFTKTPYKDTPFEQSMPVYHENAYQEWKTWWDREGYKDFERKDR